MLKAIRRASRISLITDTDPRNSAAASLLMLLSYHRRDANPDDVAAMLVPSTATALDELANAASQFGLSGEWKTTGLRDLRRPAIVPWQGSGFAVVVPPRRGRVVVHDPHGGTERMTISTATDRYGGVALELLAARPRDEGVTLARLIGQPSAFGWIATKVILLSLLMQAFLLASPYYMQLTFDRAVPSGNRQILAVLAAAFAALTLLRITTEWLRAKVLTALGEALHQQIVRRLFTHLIRLPMGWFEDRQSGEIAAGFASSTEISNLFTQDLTAAIVDGVLAIFTLAMLLIYSPLLTLVVFGCHAGLLLIRRRSIPVLTTTEDDYWRACAGERSHFMETVRSILSIKVMGREDRREDLWREKLDAVIRKSGAFERAKTQMRMAEGAVGSLENVATVYVGAQLVIEGMLTLGMLFAFFAYKTIFSSAMFRLHHAATRYRTLDVHLQRVGDIGREPTERLGPPTLAGADNLSGHIALNGLGFCYPGCDIPVLADINATIKSGEFIAITGPSGSGKSTLVKIIIGVINPTAGNILFDGRSPSALGLANLRSQLGVVLQDDVIVTGTIAQNISFFDAKPDLEWLRQCAVIAGLDEEIMARPLGYESEIYDLANGLSGGQRQRLLLARALYRRPSILILDESTSQLDFAKESEICARIARLDMTRIMITHRTATMAVAARLYTLTDGRLFESGVPQDRATSAAAG